MALTPCRGCQNPVAQSAKTCPQCGAEDPTIGKVGYGLKQIVALGIALAIGWFVWSTCDPGAVLDSLDDSQPVATTRATRATTTKPATGRPAWCVHNERIQTELALQAELAEKHGTHMPDWPSRDIDRLAQSINDQGNAAGRLWDAAPSHYDWNDVERECGSSPFS